MSYLVASAVAENITAVGETDPELWRQIRRYNLPVQLALSAAQEVAGACEYPSNTALFSLAPCQSGSPDLHHWTRLAATPGPNGQIGHFRVNPTHTLHAVDNLALSSFAIMHRNHSYCLGLGGAAGQAWSGLEALHERLAEGNETEALLIAGDQTDLQGNTGLGVALLFTIKPKPFLPLGCLVRLVGVQRAPLSEVLEPQPHAAAGLVCLISTISRHGIGRLCYTVPPAHGNGMEQITIVMDITPP
jgi:hypothetical protein